MNMRADCASAGLWEPSSGGLDDYKCVIADAAEQPFDIHAFLPAIMHPDEHDAWLNAPAEDAIALVRKYPASRLVVDRTAEPWFKAKPKSEGPILL